MKIDITALILTYNEAANIGRTLSALRWVNDVIIVDSGSTDTTVELARAVHSGVRVMERQFDSFAAQCNFGISRIETEWVLSLDADYILSPELVSDIKSLDPPSDVSGYSVEFRYCISGHPLRSSVYPPRTVLYRRSLGKYRDEGHGHRVLIDGKVQKLAGKINHDDRKALSRWIQEQDRYAKLEAEHLLETPRSQLQLQDRLRLAVYFAPVVMFFYLLFGRSLILDGWPGWFYVGQRVIAELLLSLRLLIAKHKLEAPTQVRGENGSRKPEVRGGAPSPRVIRHRE